MAVSNLRLDQFLMLAEPEQEVLRSMSTRAPATPAHGCCCWSSDASYSPQQGDTMPRLLHFLSQSPVSTEIICPGS
jgi:hypothetical protein